MKKLFEVMDMFITMDMLIVVMVSWLHTYIQTHQIVYIKYMQYFVYQLYLNKLFPKRKN